MAWIMLEQTVWTHRKTLDLADRLDLDDTYAAAHVARLWCWAIDNAVIDWERRHGLLTGMSPRVIAGGAAWKGDAPTFADAMISAGFIDRDGDDLVLHDWWDYAGKLLEERRKDRERKKKAGGRPPEFHRNSDGYPGDISRNSTPKSNSRLTVDEGDTTPLPPTPTAAAAASPPREPKYPPAFRSFWQVYPRKENKPEAFKAWSKLRPDGETCDAILAGVARWEASDQWARKVYQHPSTWLNGRQWEDEPLPATAAVSARASPNGQTPGKPSKTEIIRAGLALFQGGRVDDGGGVDEGDGGPVYDVAPSGGRPAVGGAAHRALPRGAG